MWIYFPLAICLPNQRHRTYQGAKGFIFLWPYAFQFKDSTPIKGQEDLFSSSRVPSNSEVSQIRCDDPLDMVDQLVRQIPSTNQSLSDIHSGSSNPGYSESLHQFHNNDASQMHLSVNSPKSICRRLKHYNID